jgi:tetratricopeptide (TPR) repeat protein
VNVFGYYQLRDSVASEQPTPSDWLEAARKLGATQAVRGEVAKSATGIRVTVVMLDLASGRELSHLEQNASNANFADTARVLARDVAAAALGVRTAPRASSPPLDANGELDLAIAALERHLIPEADQHVLIALTKRPDYPEARYYHALLTWWMGRPDAEVQPEIDRALATAVDPQRRGFLEGLRLFLARKHTQAIAHFRSLAAQYPADRDIQYGLFEALFHGGQPAEAMEAYRRVCDLSPHFRLGYIHPLTYYMAHGDEGGIRWLLSREGAFTDEARKLSVAQLQLARRDYKAALEQLQALNENGELKADPIYPYLVQYLIEVYAVTGLTRLAIELSQRDGHQDTMALLGIASAMGDDVAKRSWRALTVQSMRENVTHQRSLDVWLPLATIDAVNPDVAERHETALQIDEITGAEPSGSLSGEAARVLLHRGDRRAIERAQASWYPEVAAIGDALAAERNGKWPAARAAWLRATSASGDGRFLIDEWYLLAHDAHAAGDHETTIRACDEVIEPRLFQWSWGLTVGPCLVWSAEAHAARGEAAQARAAYERLLALRTRAPAGDSLVRAAREHQQ